MMNFTYSLPVDVRFGYGSRHELPRIAGNFGSKGFLIVDAGVKETDTYRSFLDACGSLVAGAWDRVLPNPALDSITEVVDRIAHAEADFIIAVGGGSALDTGKAAALVAASFIPIEKYHRGEEPIGEAAMPLLAMPTTAGSGSEVTGVAVLVDRVRGRKSCITGRSLLPRVSIIDPEWALTLPAGETASCAMVALTHALESCWSRNAQPLSDAFAEKAICLILEALPTVWEDGGNRLAHETMAAGSLMAGLASAIARPGAVHSCAFALTQRFGWSHGQACAATMTEFLRFNAAVVDKKIGNLARSLDEKDSRSLGRRLDTLHRAMGLTKGLEKLGDASTDLDALVAESLSHGTENNSREVTTAVLKEIYTRAGARVTHRSKRSEG